MTVVSFSAFKETKKEQEHVLQYAKTYNVSVKEVKAIMDDMVTNTTTVTTLIAEAEALEALEGAISSEQLVKMGLMEEQVISTLDDTVGTRLETGDYESVDIGLSLLASDKVVMFPGVSEYTVYNKGPDDDIKVIQWNPDIPW